MALEYDKKGYPICDSDIWIKVCQIDKVELIFHKYNNTFISDAVIQELHKKKTDNPEIFGHCLDKCHEANRNGKVIYLKLCDREVFDDKLKNDTIRQFAQYGILYNEKECRFITNKKNLGEMVSAIYASVHGLALILSDDKGTDSFVEKNYRYLQVIKLRDLLLFHGIGEQEIKALISAANRSCNYEPADDSAANNKSFSSLKKALKGVG